MLAPELQPLALLGLGFLLGLRHAMDPDHVVAVTAIAARTRRALPAALLGIAWGAGHTLTLWLVGAAIIVFDLVVPARVGLALEFAVALALVGLGFILAFRANLTNVGGEGQIAVGGIAATALAALYFWRRSSAPHALPLAVALSPNT